MSKDKEIVAVGYNGDDEHNYIYYILGGKLYYDFLFKNKYISRKLEYLRDYKYNKQEWGEYLLSSAVNINITLVDTWGDIQKHRMIRELLK